MNFFIIYFSEFSIREYCVIKALNGGIKRTFRQALSFWAIIDVRCGIQNNIIQKYEIFHLQTIL
jgi:hypothetical protein